MSRSSRVLVYLALTAAFGLYSPASAEETSAASVQSEVQQLRQQQEALARQMKAIQERIEALATRAGAPKPTAEETDAEALHRAAEEAAGPAPAQSEKTPEEVTFTNMNQLQSAANPEISFIGDMVGSINDNEGEAGFEPHGPPYLKGRDKFTLPVAELAFQLPVDPFCTAKTFLHFHDGGVEVEEAYLDYANVAGWNLRIGQMRPTISLFNRWHEHALPQVDSPRVYNWHFEDGCFKDLGVEVSRLLPPTLGADSNELFVSLFNGGNDYFLAGGEEDRPALGFHLNNYYDLSDSAYLQWGVGGLAGYTEAAGGNRTYLGTLDLSYDWSPVQEAKYRGLTARAELFWQRREQSDFIGHFKQWRPAGLAAEPSVTSLGGWTYLEQTFARNWKRGVRFDYTQLPDRDSEHEWGVSPYITWWQSEPIRWRLQFSHYARNFLPDENVLFLQLDWGVGPHRHDEY
ncbi:MAG: hypothetical protein GW911_04360 [Armatimonadetes bacterium]|nr:hypothetical protein [Armatimonadota bacterium]NCO91562.1 hypothetical protein [Armatimonadota bacterium]NCP30105.1 hypothetical protein [Armatimonadota bacterium]NDK11273.1 hypothetical protein [Armatimonadota bacterium]